ncbi:unnamed protein product [Rangifer tarandus platyrhynchus]|uniref:Uncharacterized protein n=2 Tax=Rangifer tarandus platyrhynchus TaxID=3082113 RepID=A0ACB0E8U3_RANTA|nr:unnamed protein product [Rangifer tarandus platyrhynchus]CAI9697067.1 unnamed protein product [Rangifer tarandus platyrhynchus]
MWHQPLQPDSTLTKAHTPGKKSENSTEAQLVPCSLAAACRALVPDTFGPELRVQEGCTRHLGSTCRSAAHRSEIQDGGGRRSAETLRGALHPTRSAIPNSFRGRNMKLDRSD